MWWRSLVDKRLITWSICHVDSRNGELVCPSDSEGLVSSDVSPVQGSIILPCPPEITIENFCCGNSPKNDTSSKRAIFWNASVRFEKTGQHRENRNFDPGGPVSTTKAASSGVLRMGVNRMRLWNLQSICRTARSVIVSLADRAGSYAVFFLSLEKLETFVSMLTTRW